MNAVQRLMWFRVVSVLAVLWNLFGLWSFYAHVTATPEVIATWPEVQQQIDTQVENEVQKQVDAKAAAQGISIEAATRQLLGEKEPSMQFTTPEELAELAVFFCSSAANNVRGVAWNMDGGWMAQ